MNQVMSEGRYQLHAPLPYIQTPICQQTSHNQCIGFFQGGQVPVKFLPEGSQSLQSVAMSSTPAPQPPANSVQYYGDMRNCTQAYCMAPLPVGYPQGSPVRFLPLGTQKQAPAALSTTQTPQTPPSPFTHSRELWRGSLRSNKPPLPGNAGDSTPCQLHSPGSAVPQEVAGSSTHSSHKPVEDALYKREHRLMKNREAARECRRKKKEYVKCLENRVAVLENQNKTLIEELRALKDVYRHKVE